MSDFKLNATTAKIKAIYGKHLKLSEYKELMALKSVAEVAEYLKKKPRYSEALSNIDTTTIHRGFLEATLRKYNFENYINICKFQQLDEKPFYNYLMIDAEISEILNIILHLNAGSSDEYIIALPSYLINMISFNLMEMAKIHTFDEMLKLLKHTPYYNALIGIKKNQNGQVNLTECEVRLRTYYLKWMTDTVKKAFPKKSGNDLTSQIKVQTDLINIINMYRMKYYFNMSAEDIKKNILPLNGRLTEKKTNELLETTNRDEFISSLCKTIYGKQLKEIPDMDSDVYLEHELTKLRYNLAYRSLMFSDNAAVSIYSVMYLLNTELENIINIIEAIRYGKDISYMESILIVR